jgi:hypothetical protein
MSLAVPSEAVNLCRSNNAKLLLQLIQTEAAANSVIPQFKHRMICRARVPLLSVAAAYGSPECVVALLDRKAKVDAEDGIGVRFVLTVETDPLGLHCWAGGHSSGAARAGR